MMEERLLGKSTSWRRKKSKEWHKKYYQEHKEQKSVQAKRRYQKRGAEIREKSKKFRLEKKDKAVELFGRKCAFCGNSSRYFVFHEKTGKRHNSGGGILALKMPENFVLLCYVCHKGVHWCMSALNLSWEQIWAIGKKK